MLSLVGLGSIPAQGTKILQAAQSRKKKGRKKEMGTQEDFCAQEPHRVLLGFKMRKKEPLDGTVSWVMEC